jgi:hypothetical protein
VRVENEDRPSIGRLDRGDTARILDEVPNGRSVGRCAADAELEQVSITVE